MDIVDYWVKTAWKWLTLFNVLEALAVANNLLENFVHFVADEDLHGQTVLPPILHSLL